MASLFGLSGSDLLKKLVPLAGSGSSTFSIGTTGPPTNDMSSADALAIIEWAESQVEGYCRPKYQKLLRRVEGEIIVRAATAGQATAQLTMIPATSCTLYKNFPRSRAWFDRQPREAMNSDQYSVNLATGAITFSPVLCEGDVIYADYAHSGCGLLLDLRELALSLAAVEVSRRFSYFRSADGVERFEAWQSSAAGYLRDLGRADGAGIALLDRLNMVNETRGSLNIGMLC